MLNASYKLEQITAFKKLHYFMKTSNRSFETRWKYKSPVLLFDMGLSLPMTVMFNSWMNILMRNAWMKHLSAM